MQREGHWGEKHPLTDYHYPRIQLPESLGNRSYLSGLDVTDPWNMLVPNLRPPKDSDGK